MEVRSQGLGSPAQALALATLCAVLFLTSLDNPAIQTIINKLVHAAYTAFGDGLHQALVLSGSLILLGAVVAALTIRVPKGQAQEL